jgi:competence protein ComEC
MSHHSSHVEINESTFSRKTRYQPLVLCLLAAVFGTWLDDRFDLGFWLYALVIVVSGAVWALFFACLPATSHLASDPESKTGDSQRSLFKNSSDPKSRSPVTRQWALIRRGFYRVADFRISAICLICAVSAAFALWHHIRWNWVGQNDISQFVNHAGAPICLDAVVTTEPRWMTPNDSNDGMNYRPGMVRTRLGIRAWQLRDGTAWRTVSGHLDLVIQGRLTSLRNGDRIRVFGKLVELSPPTNPGQFDFQKYYRAQGKRVVLHAYFQESVELVERRSGAILRPLSLLRYELNELVWKYLNPDEAAFASAIMLGNREQLSAERRESFLKTGTSHLLAISGLHVGILAGVFWMLFRIGLLSRNQALYATIAFVVFYAWLVEFRPPALRAAVLIVTFCVGRLLGKPGFSFNLLSLAGLVMLVLNPRDLFNLGAQLSFLAVATLIFASAWINWQPSSDPLDRLIASKRIWPVRCCYWTAVKIRVAFLVSAWIWTVGLPLVAFHFNLMAPIALLVNPLLLLPLSLGLYCGLGVMVFGLIVSPLANILGKCCEWNLNLVERMIHFAERIPHGHMATAGPPLWAVVGFYLGLFVFAIFPVTRLRFKWLAMLAVVWYVACWRVPDVVHRWQERNRTDELVCTFIDVNHGSAVLLQMPGGQRILYDAGSFGSSVFGYRSISGVLWSERIESIDTVIISHADLDHYNAIPELARRFRIGEVLMTRRTLVSGSPSVQMLLSQLRQRQIPMRTVHSDDGAATSQQNLIHSNIRILSPPRAGTGGNDNSDSLVLLVECSGYRILLTGDLEGPGMEQLMAQAPIQCDLVMAPHHGSFNSDPTGFMNWCTPRAIIISGEGSRIRERSVAVFAGDRRTVYRTDQDGAIRCVVTRGRHSFQTWNGQRWSESLQTK